MAEELEGETSSANGEIMERCCVDAITCYGLPNGGSVDCYNMKSEPVVEGNGKEEADRSYVYVNGSDSVGEGGDNENGTDWAFVEESADKLKRKTDAEEAKGNGSNGCCSDKVVEIEETFNVDNGKETDYESGGIERDNIQNSKDSSNGHCSNKVVEIEETFKVEDGKETDYESGEIQRDNIQNSKDGSNNLDPVQEVDVVNSTESVSLGVAANREKEFEVESSFKVVDNVPESPEVHGDAICSNGCKDNGCNEPIENDHELLEQVMSASEIVKEISVSEPATGYSVEEHLAEDSKSDPIMEERVEESRQLSSNAEIEEKQETVHMDNDAEQENLVEVDAESLSVDHLSRTGGDHAQTAESSDCLGLDTNNPAITNSHVEISQSSETFSVPDQISITQGNGDSCDASLGMNDQDATLVLGEVLASSDDYSSMPVEGAECPPVAEEMIVAINENVVDRSLPVDDDISSTALDDGQLPAKLEVVNDAEEQILEARLEEAKPTSSAYAEMESRAQDGLPTVNDTSIDLHATKSAEIQICFGSIGHEELSSLSMGGRSSKAKSAVNAYVSCPLPDHESHENADNNIGTSHGAEVFDAVPWSDEVSPLEASVVGLAEAKPDVPEVESRFFNYLVRLPRYDGELTIQIKDAQAQLDEKTRVRDAINAEIQIIRVTRNSFIVELEAASAKERTARDSLKSKWLEIDSVQSVLNKVKNSMSIDDISNRIQSMEHRIQHETMPLNEEKLLLREIKQLKQSREQLTANMGNLEELNQALEQKEQTEERLKVLRKEVESLRGNVSRAEVVTKAAKKKHYDENGKLQELQAKFRAADAVRQEAYSHLRSLRMQLKGKNEYFNKYRDDAMRLNDLVLKGHRNNSYQFCINQVEEFMKLWNDNEGFRNNYVNWSLKGTLRRLGTKDGRSLGVDEQPPSIPPHISERVVKDISTSAFPSLEQAMARAVPVEAVPSSTDVPVKSVEQKKQESKAKAPAKPSETVESVASSVPVRDVEATVVIEESKKVKEEEEKARKEEELRREEEEEAKLKERRRLEEKAKAEAALERKKRNTERAQARAAAKAQKEAEQKEKEKEKKLKKKEKKKAAGSAPSDSTTEGEPAPSSETLTVTPKEPEVPTKIDTAAKRPYRPAHLKNQIKMKSAIPPPPLRNRGKRKMQPWMWVLLIASVVLVLFLAGNSRQLFF
ncbi:hypothetical protein SAY87_010734 [Trapa incisa]|uniref:Uncharacterized protein n=1 Tax=Trapa incisa TaxID=236973 RepID=A0AAN7GQV2_9MYRT|nr:hypothetical protein SAY87_010734 [Trapa incisa]